MKRELLKAFVWHVSGAFFFFLLIMPWFLFGNCAMTTGCSKDQQIAGYQWHADYLRRLP